MCVCHAPSRPASVASLLSLTLSSFLLSLLLSGSIEEVLVAQPCSRVWCSCPQSSQNSLSTISSLYPVSRGPTETFTLCQIFVTFVVVAWLTTICSFCLYLLLPDLVLSTASSVLVCSLARLKSEARLPLFTCKGRISHKPKLISFRLTQESHTSSHSPPALTPEAFACLPRLQITWASQVSSI